MGGISCCSLFATFPAANNKKYRERRGEAEFPCSAASKDLHAVLLPADERERERERERRRGRRGEDVNSFGRALPEVPCIQN